MWECILLVVNVPRIHCLNVKCDLISVMLCYAVNITENTPASQEFSCFGEVQPPNLRLNLLCQAGTRCTQCVCVYVCACMCVCECVCAWGSVGDEALSTGRIRPSAASTRRTFLIHLIKELGCTNVCVAHVCVRVHVSVCMRVCLHPYEPSSKQQGFSKCI